MPNLEQLGRTKNKAWNINKAIVSNSPQGAITSAVTYKTDSTYKKIIKTINMKI